MSFRPILAIILLAGISYSASQTTDTKDKDPHRPSCTSKRCKQIKLFLKQHYCGEPVGNGPDDSCDTREVKKPVQTTKITADYECNLNETDGSSKCAQKSEPSSEARALLLREMRRIGLPVGGEKEVHYVVMESTSGWVLTMANYEHVTGDNVDVCQIILARKDEDVHVLRALPFQRADADVPEVTRWTPVDIADADGDGRMEVILEADAYENHWFEVVSLQDFRTIFSGLGYYL
jgi:hypothetical protein